MISNLKQIRALCAIRLRLLWNTIRSRSGLGRIIGLSFAAFIMFIATASGASDLLQGIYQLPFANLLAEWTIGLLVFYAILIVFTGDLVSGHTLNTGQMSSDFHYLSTLPIPTTSLIFIKIFEKLITDYFGILFLLPALIGISCFKAYTWNGFLAGFLIYVETGIVTGLLINLVLIALSRFFKPSTINNFFSIFGYVSAIVTLIPFLLLSDFNPVYIPKILEILDYAQTYAGWLIAPIRWIATPLLLSTPFCIEFGKLTILWFALTVILTTLFYSAVKNNWFGYAHSRKALTGKVSRKRLFSGLFHKEFIMLKSDFNLLVNAVFMPISIIIVEIYFMKQVFSFTSMYSVMNFIFGSIIYFSMFGPINIIGYEGKSMTILEALPITPAQLIKKKFSFWCILALIIFVPATIATFRIINFDTHTTIIATLQAIAFTSCAVWLTVCLSAIFAQYDTNVLQQRSTFVGKMAAMSLLTLLLNAKTLTYLNTFTILLFITIAYLCYIKAKAYLAFRQDKEALETDNHLMLNAFLLFLSFIALETTITHTFLALSPDSDTGIWNWSLSLPLILPFVILNRKKRNAIFPKTSLPEMLKAVLIALCSIAGTVLYLKASNTILDPIREDAQQIIDFCRYLIIPTSFWKLILVLLGTTFMTAFTKRAEEFFVSDKSLMVKALGCLLMTLASPPALMPAVLFYMILIYIFSIRRDSTAICTYSAILFYLLLFIYLIWGIC